MKNATHRNIFLLVCMALSTSPGAAQTENSLMGVWRDPNDTVHVRTEPCGERVCGVVIWASEAAKADAKRGGTDDLIGTTVFRDFKQEKENVWRGRVFVPDIRATFSGTLTLVGKDQLRGSGCLLGKIVCKTRTWNRVS